MYNINLRSIIQGIAFIASILGLLLMFVDKSNAKQRKSRIPESTFLFISILGGGLAVFLGGLLFHHKTSKPSFMFKILLGILINVGLVYLLYS